MKRRGRRAGPAVLDLAPPTAARDPLELGSLASVPGSRLLGPTRPRRPRIPGQVPPRGIPNASPGHSGRDHLKLPRAAHDGHQRTSAVRSPSTSETGVHLSPMRTTHGGWDERRWGPPCLQAWAGGCLSVGKQASRRGTPVDVTDLSGPPLPPGHPEPLRPLGSRRARGGWEWLHRRFHVGHRSGSMRRTNGYPGRPLTRIS
jgi:hypothetical protein